MISKDVVRGTFIGIALGDALGMPVETFSFEQIQKSYGRITDLLSPKDHKWFKDEPAGMITDDTQLTLAVAEALIEGIRSGDAFSMDLQAAHHIAAFRKSTKGWGGSTRNSVRNLANGVDWSNSGQADGAWTGRGNGVPMKVAPVGLYITKVMDDTTELERAFEFIGDLSMMTHRTSISASAAFTQILATYFCAISDPVDFDSNNFIPFIVKASSLGRTFLPDTIGEDDLTNKLELLCNHEEYTTEKMIAEFGAGSCYCYHSMPFSLMHFVRNPHSLDCLYDVVSAGGDTDSNGSMVGALLGALHGEAFFPKELVDKLLDKDQIFDVADRFSEALLT